MKTILVTIGAGILTVGGWLGFAPENESPFIYTGPLNQTQESQVRNLVDEMLDNAVRQSLVDQYDPTFGAVIEPFAGTTYNLSGAGVAASSSVITLQSLTISQTAQPILDANLSDTFYITLEPGSKTRQEIVSCTTVVQNAGGTATLSGCIRGLAPIPPFTASTTLRFAHGGGTQAIFSDPPQLFNQFAAKENDESITGLFNFNTSPIIGTATNTSQAATRKYVDDIAISGAGTSTFVSTGLVQLAKNEQLADGVASSTDVNYRKPLVLSSLYATSTLGANIAASGGTGEYYIPISKTNGKLDQAWLDLSENFEFTGASTTISIRNQSTTTMMGGVGIGTTSPTLVNNGLSIASSTYMQGGLGVGKATTTSGVIESSSHIQVGGKIFGLYNPTLTSGYRTIASTSASVAGPTAADAVIRLTVNCPSGYWALSGGVEDNTDGSAGSALTQSFPLTSGLGWRVAKQCALAACTAHNFTVTVMCIQN